MSLFVFIFDLGFSEAVCFRHTLKGKARIGRSESSWLTMVGKIIDGSSTRRPRPYSTRPRSSKTNKNEKFNDERGNTYDNPLTILDESDTDLERNEHDDAGRNRTDLGYAANEDMWPEQFPAEFDMRVSTIGKLLSNVTDRS